MRRPLPEIAAGRAFAAVMIVTAVLTLPFLGARDLWAPDENRYAQVAQEALADGHWWHPHVNGRPYLDKPPLYFWAAAVLSLPFGRVDEATARLPSVLAALLATALTFDLGRRLPLGGRRRAEGEASNADHATEGESGDGPERLETEPDGASRRLAAGAVAALALATTWLWSWLARRVNLDVPLSAAVVAAAWSSWRAHESLVSNRRGRAAAFAGLAGAAVALGVMTKGPVLLLPVAGVAIALAAHPELRGRRAPGAAAASAAGLGVFAAVIAAWLVPAARLGGYDAFGIVGEHVIERAAHGRHHVQPAWYYLRSLLVDLLPWTPLAILGVVSALRRRHRAPTDVLLLAWTLVPLVVLSAIVEKRSLYLLPTYPAWALLVGRFVARLPSGAPAPRPMKIAARLDAALAALVGGVVLIGAALLGRLEATAELVALPGLRASLVGLGLLALAAGVACWRAPRRPAVGAAVAIALAFGALELGVQLTLPRVDGVKSTRATGEAIARLAPVGPLASWPRYRAGYTYHSGRTMAELERRDELIAWLERVDRPAHVLTWEEWVDEAPPDGARPPRRVFEAPAGSHRAILLEYAASPSLPETSELSDPARRSGGKETRPRVVARSGPDAPGAHRPTARAESRDGAVLVSPTAEGLAPGRQSSSGRDPPRLFAGDTP